MSVKIKINWDNENVVSESVRIYRADSIFTPTSLPPLLTEIFGDIYEYEDLTTVENQTYFYMLSCLLGDQEVFTECFEVLSTPHNPEIIVNFSEITQTFIAKLPNSVIRSRGLSPIPNSNNYLALIYDTQAKLVEVDPTGVIIKSLLFGAYDVYTCQFSDKGLVLRVIKSNKDGWGVRTYVLTTAYDISTAILSSSALLPASTNGYNVFLFANPKTFYAATTPSNNIKKISLNNNYDFNSVASEVDFYIYTDFSQLGISGIIFSETGFTALAMLGSFSGSYQQIVSLNLTAPFDLQSYSVVKSVNLNKDTLGLQAIYLRNGIITEESIANEFYVGSYMRDLIKINIV